MRHIVFVKTSSLGDIIHHMPAITDARAYFPGDRFTWIVEDSFVPLARLHRGVDEVIPISTRRWRHQLLSAGTWREISSFLKEIRSVEADTVIDTQGLIRSAVITKTVGGERHGFDRRSVREPLASFFYDAKHHVEREMHAIARNRLLTGLSLGYTPKEMVDYGLARPPELRRLPYALLLHGTTRRAKEWSERNWIDVGRQISDSGLDVLLPWASERERGRCLRFAKEIPRSTVLGSHSIDEMARIIAGASLVVGVDTGMLHLAAAYAVPLIAIFLASDPGLTGPVGNGSITIVGDRASVVPSKSVCVALEKQFAYS